MKKDISQINTDKTAAVEPDTWPILPNVLYNPQKIPDSSYARTNAYLQFSTTKWWILIEDTWFQVVRIRPDRNPLWIQCLLKEGGTVTIPWCSAFKVTLA